ncbi:MAG: glycosyltransferase family 2 protein, partial [Owenweeksia sp.]
QFKRKDVLYHPGYYNIPESPQKLIVPDFLGSVLHGEQVITASSVCIPRSILEEVGLFDEHIRDGEDQDLWNRIALQYPVAFHWKASAVYRQDADNMLTRHVPKNELDYAVKIQRLLDEGKIPQNKEDVMRKIIAANLIGVASMNILAGDKTTARKFLDDPRSRLLPEKRQYWVSLMRLPSFLVRILYNWRRKLLQKR